MRASQFKNFGSRQWETRVDKYRPARRLSLGSVHDVVALTRRLKGAWKQMHCMSLRTPCIRFFSAKLGSSDMPRRYIEILELSSSQRSLQGKYSSMDLPIRGSRLGPADLLC